MTNAVSNSENLLGSLNRENFTSWQWKQMKATVKNSAQERKNKQDGKLSQSSMLSRDQMMKSYKKSGGRNAALAALESIRKNQDKTKKQDTNKSQNCQKENRDAGGEQEEQVKKSTATSLSQNQQTAMSKKKQNSRKVEVPSSQAGATATTSTSTSSTNTQNINQTSTMSAAGSTTNSTHQGASTIKQCNISHKKNKPNKQINNNNSSDQEDSATTAQVQKQAHQFYQNMNQCAYTSDASTQADEYEMKSCGIKNGAKQSNPKKQTQVPNSVSSAKVAEEDKQQQLGQPRSYQHKIKTELCKNWEMHGKCKYELSCSFAHGKHELSKKKHMPRNYKSKPCEQFHDHDLGFCTYSNRCQFLHSQIDIHAPNVSYSVMLHENARLSAQRLELVDIGINQESKNQGFVTDQAEEIIYINVFNKNATKAASNLTQTNQQSQARLSVFQKMCRPVSNASSSLQASK